MKEKFVKLFNDKRAKIFFFIVFIAFIFTAFFQVYDAYKTFTKPTTYEQIDKIYKNQIYQSDFDSFVKENQEKKYFRKITFAGINTVDYFEVVLEDKENKKNLETYQVYKNPGETWIIDFKKYQSFTGLGFYTPERDKFIDFLIQLVVGIVPLIFFMGLMFFMYKKMGLLPGGNQSTIKRFKGSNKNKVTFDQIGGIDSIKGEIQDLILTLSNWTDYQKRGVRTIRGILFAGPPGVGKTMIAKAVASTLGIDMFIATGNDFRSEYLSMGPKRVHQVFSEIKKSLQTDSGKIAILFIDEIETVFKTRGTGHSEDSNTVNAFLHEIDGINGETNIIVIGATNHIDKLDAALLSRMDKVINFNYPTRKERVDIITKILESIKLKDENIKIDEKLDVNILAGNTMRMGGREIDNILNEVHRRAVRDNKIIDNYLIQECFGDVILGKDNSGLDVNGKDKEIVTYHELGHGVLGYLNKKIVHTISIIPKGGALGLTWSLDKDEKVLRSPEDILREIQELVAGRIAEKIWIGEISTGSSNDYERATNLAISYFKHYNFSYKSKKLGLIFTDRVSDNKIYESEILGEIKPLVESIISDQEKFVEKVLRKNKKEIEKLAVILKKDEVIFEKDLKESNLSF